MESTAAKVLRRLAGVPCGEGQRAASGLAQTLHVRGQLWFSSVMYTVICSCEIWFKQRFLLLKKGLKPQSQPWPSRG